MKNMNWRGIRLPWLFFTFIPSFVDRNRMTYNASLPCVHGQAVYEELTELLRYLDKKKVKIRLLPWIPLYQLCDRLYLVSAGVSLLP